MTFAPLGQGPRAGRTFSVTVRQGLKAIIQARSSAVQ